MICCLCLWLPKLSAEEAPDSLPVRSSLFIIPNVAYQPETDFAFGVAGAYYAKSRDISRINSMSGSMYYTLRNQFLLNLSPKFYFGAGKYYLHSNLKLQSYPDFYYGRGKRLLAERQAYISRKLEVNNEIQREVLTHFFIGAQLSLITEFARLVTDSARLKQQIFEHYGTAGWELYRNISFGAVLRYDSRDNPFYPYCGLFLRTAFDLSSTHLLSSYSLRRFSFDLRHYISTWQGQVAAWQVLLKGAWGSRGILPFQLLPSLGGRDAGRGFPAGMYSDNLLALWQGEYRIPIYKRLKASFFLSAGDVFNSSNAKGSGIKLGYGAGLRFRLNDARVHLRLDLARNNWDKTLRFYITATEAF